MANYVIDSIETVPEMSLRSRKIVLNRTKKMIERYLFGPNGVIELDEMDYTMFDINGILVPTDPNDWTTFQLQFGICKIGDIMPYRRISVSFHICPHGASDVEKYPAFDVRWDGSYDVMEWKPIGDTKNVCYEVEKDTEKPKSRYAALVKEDELKNENDLDKVFDDLKKNWPTLCGICGKKINAKLDFHITSEDNRE